MVILVARNVIKNVSHAMEELPQTVRLVQKDFIVMVIMVARNVIKYVKHVMEKISQTV